VSVTVHFEFYMLMYISCLLYVETNGSGFVLENTRGAEIND